MKKSSPPLLALAAIVILTLSACSSTPSPAPIDPTPLPLVHPLCLQRCGLIPQPTGPTEPEIMRWELQIVQWGERCKAINDDCLTATLED